MTTLDTAAAAEIERLREVIDVLEARLEAAERAHARPSHLSGADDWRLMASHYEFEWQQCSAAFNSYAGRMKAKLAESERQRKALVEQLERIGSGGVDAAVGAWK